MVQVDLLEDLVTTQRHRDADRRLMVQPVATQSEQPQEAVNGHLAHEDRHASGADLVETNVQKL